MKILHFSNKPIYPRIDGGCVAMSTFVDLLILSGCHVKHFCISTDKHPFDINKYPADLREKIHPESFYINTKVNVSGAIKNFFKKGSFNVNRFYSPTLATILVEEIQSNDYDIIIFDSLFTTVYLKDIQPFFNGKIILRAHNIESELWRFFATHERSYIKSLYLKKLASDLSKYEINILKQVDAILTISKEDEQRILNMGVNQLVTTIPFTINIPKNKQNHFKNNNIFHLGAMNWEPNVEAVNRLIHLFAKLKTDTELHLAGSFFPENFRTNEKIKVFIDGFVDDPFDYAIEHGIMISPILSGSGVRIKVLEMMAIGIPVVTSKIGAQGINYKENDCLVVAETDDEFIEAITILVENEDARKKIGKNAIKYIKENHDIHLVKKQFIDFIEKI